MYRVGAVGEIGVGKRQGLLYYLIAGPAGLINGAVVFPAVERLIRTGQRLGYNVAQLYRGSAGLAEHNDFAHGDVCLARVVIRSEEYHKTEVLEKRREENILVLAHILAHMNNGVAGHVFGIISPFVHKTGQLIGGEVGSCRNGAL